MRPGAPTMNLLRRGNEQDLLFHDRLQQLSALRAHAGRAAFASTARSIDAFVAICDEPLPATDPRDDYTEISIRELGLPQFDRFVFQYTILELNTAIKPWVIAALFERGYERVIYFDPDIKLYGSVDAILARLEHADIVLTPHLTGALDDGKHPSELTILQSGSYNLGFIALRASDETRRFVAWWQGKLLRDCVVDIPRGLFTDQKWIDLVPGMYGGVADRARSRLERRVLEPQPPARGAKRRQRSA